MELATGHAPYANFSLTNIIIMTMHSPVPELERTFSDVSLLFHFVVVSMLHFPLLYPCPQACLSSIISQRPPLPMLPSPPCPAPPLFCLRQSRFEVPALFAKPPPPTLPSPKDPGPLSSHATHRQKLRFSLSPVHCSVCHPHPAAHPQTTLSAIGYSLDVLSFCNHVVCTKTPHTWEYRALGWVDPQ